MHVFRDWLIYIKISYWFVYIKSVDGCQRMEKWDCLPDGKCPYALIILC